MARRRNRSELSVSLFPFLSVMSCVIGTLTLMIAAVAIGRVAEDLEIEPTRAPIPDEVLLTPADLAAFAEQLEQAELREQQLEALRAELRAAGLDPDASASERAQIVSNRVELARLRSRTKELEIARAELGEALDGVRSESSERKRRARAAPITIQPHGEGSGLIPFFVECSAEGLRIHRQGRERTVLLHIDDLAEAARFQAFLRRVRVTRSGTVIFLIRPDGVDSYRRALQEVEKLTVRHGQLPLPGEGKLDFSLF